MPLSDIKQLARRYRTRIGRFDPPGGKTVLVCIDGNPSARATAFIQEFSRQFPREHLLFMDSNAPIVPLVHGAHVPPPFPLWGGRRYLRRLRTAAVYLDEGVKAPGKLLALAQDCDIRVSDLPVADTDTNAWQHVLSDLDYEMGREREPRQPLKKRFKYYLWQQLVLRLNPRGIERLVDIHEVSRALGQPQRILCLGNGPSSEDLAEDESAYEAVFRVNDRWLERGLFTRPSVVFTGAADCVSRVGGGPLYGFLNDTRALPIVRKLRGQVLPLRFFTATDLAFPLREFDQRKPTNGLLMLYLAVKLQPAQLTVAGIDLYRDPRGCYPDDNSTPNHYTSVHNPDLEVDTIVQLLRAYSGRLTIVGERLAEEYERTVHA